MNTRHLLAAIATAALVTGGQAIAQGRGGGHGGGMGGGNAGGMGAGASGNAGAMRSMDARAMSSSSSDVSTQSHGRGAAGTNHDPIERLRSGSRRSHRDRSRAQDHASDTGVENSNENSVLHDETTTTPTADANATVDTDTNTPPAAVETRTDARANSQGPANASPIGVTNSNENSVLHDSTTTTTTATTPPTENQPAGTTGVDTRTDARANSQGPANASPTGVTNANENSVLRDTTTTTATTPPTENQPAGTTGVDTRTDARANSQGPANASPTGVANSNENSVLHDSTAPASDLTGLRTGLVVRDSSGTQIGTISRIVTTPDGRIQNVLVTSADRRTIRLAPGTLTLSGDVVTATSVGGPDNE